MYAGESTIIVTGGCGFIGSNLIRMLLAERDWNVVNIDALTYAGCSGNLDDLAQEPRYRFVKGDVCDRALVGEVFDASSPRYVFHLAAESHVDRSISEATPFLRTNVEGTHVVLESARACRVERLLYCSTDEVYGDLGPTGCFTLQTPINPSSPYSASKAAGDMLARAYHRTHGLDVVVTRCSNNYGPYQFPEKLIPLMITNAIDDIALPVYGDGRNVRDWLHVDDHCRGMLMAMEKGTAGAAYNFGGSSERENIAVVTAILDAVDKTHELIRYVTDRPGHDRRYAIDWSASEEQLGWKPSYAFDEGLTATVNWYRHNEAWWRRLKDGSFKAFYAAQYGAQT